MPRWLRIAIPSVFLVLALFGTLLYMPLRTWLLWFGLAMAYIIPPAGKETVIPGGVALGMHPWEMTYLLVMIDLAGALFIILNFGFAKRLPVLGRYIRFMERKGASTLTESTTLKAGIWVGLVLFHMIPFQGSGGLTAGIIGRAIGMRTTPLVAAVTLGSLISGLTLAYSASYAKGLLLLDWGYGLMVILLAALAALSMFAAHRLMRIRKWERLDLSRRCEGTVAAC
jgi:uncharacterized membrane protein